MSEALHNRIRAILGSSIDRPRICARDLNDQFRRLEEADYRKKLDRQFTRKDLKDVLGRLHQELPGLNRRVFQAKDPRILSGIADRLGAQFLASSFADLNAPLRGFYLKEGGASKRPLICVNAASHPVARASAFWHEVGHHLTSELIHGGGGTGVEMEMFELKYHRHMDRPEEIAADLVSALAVYPFSSARKLFGSFAQAQHEVDAGELLSRASAHIRAVSGFQFRAGGRPAFENLNYLAGMLHYVKLRWTLFSEYNV